MKDISFCELVYRAVSKEVLKKLVFSRPKDSEISKISARLVAHRGKRMLAMEMSLPGDTVSHKNVPENEILEEVAALLSSYRQADLITTLGNAEYKLSKRGESVVLGADALLRKLDGSTPSFESAIEALDRKKNYILRGNEEFLIKLGISSRDGRVHDKKQGKFRQINRFLEHIEDVYQKLPEGELTVFDLCCGKSYLSFAVYYYLTEVKKRTVRMFGADLKRDVIIWCEQTAADLGYGGMSFAVADISKLDYRDYGKPDMVISLHACDVATDIVIDTAVRLEAGVILSTPCCHRYMNGRINNGELSFITDHPQISVKLCEAATDALRCLRLSASGYSVTALELTDPENTPKNTLIRAVKNPRITEKQINASKERYESALKFLFGDSASAYLKDLI